MKEKKFYETPFTTVTQIVTEGVFAASGVKGDVIVPEGTMVDINEQGSFETAGLDFSNSGDIWLK